MACRFAATVARLCPFIHRLRHPRRVAFHDRFVWRNSGALVSVGRYGAMCRAVADVVATADCASVGTAAVTALSWDEGSHPIADTPSELTRTMDDAAAVIKGDFPRLDI
jgi:hypothetical protein